MPEITLNRSGWLVNFFRRVFVTFPQRECNVDSGPENTKWSRAELRKNIPSSLLLFVSGLLP